MSDEDTRNERGQFVKRAAQKAQDMHTVGDDGMHPMAKVFFGWVDHKMTGTIIFWLVLLLAAGLIAVDLLIDRHDYFTFANWNGFYGFWGFGAFAFVVLMGWPLGKLLRRDEDYYGDSGGPPADIDPDLDPENLPGSHGQGGERH
jgi:hypothetical protein